MRVPHHSTLSAASPCLSLLENQFFHVLDFAQYGSLRDYLFKILRGTDEEWPILVGFMSNIIGGL